VVAGDGLGLGRLRVAHFRGPILQLIGGAALKQFCDPGKILGCGSEIAVYRRHIVAPCDAADRARFPGDGAITFIRADHLPPIIDFLNTAGGERRGPVYVNRLFRMAFRERRCRQPIPIPKPFTLTERRVTGHGGDAITEPKIFHLRFKRAPPGDAIVLSEWRFTDISEAGLRQELQCAAKLANNVENRLQIVLEIDARQAPQCIRFAEQRLDH